MTPSELALALDDDLEKERPPMGAPQMSGEEIAEYAARWRAMTPRERLEKIRGG